MIKAIYGNKVELLQRESMGLVTEDMQSVFKSKYVNRLYEMHPHKLVKAAPFIFCATDPNGKFFLTLTLALPLHTLTSFNRRWKQ